MEARPFTPNQVVAHNLALIRRRRKLSLEKAVERLEPYVGTKWARENLSAMERSVTGKRPREFDAGLLIAFARAFDVSPLWFLLPPAEASEIDAPNPLAEQPPRRGGTREKQPFTPDDLVDLVLFRGWTDMHERLAEPGAHRGKALEAQRALLDSFVAEAAATAEPEQRLREAEEKLLEAAEVVRQLSNELSDYRFEAARRLRRSYGTDTPMGQSYQDAMKEES